MNRFDTVKVYAIIWAVSDWNEECVPSDLIASRVREAVLLFDNKEARNLGIQERKAFNHGWARINTDGETPRAGGKVTNEVVRRSFGGCFGAVGGKYRCAQLHVFTRNYTLLHKVPAR